MLHIQKLKTLLNSNIFLVFLIIITIISLIYKLNNIKSAYNNDSNEFIGIIYDIKIDTNYVVLYVKSKENIIVYYNGINKFNLGDKVYINGTFNELNSNTIFNLFNYKKYMLSKNIYYNIKADNIKIIRKNKGILYSIKTYLKNRIGNNGYLNAFLLGDNSYIPSEIMESYRSNGVSHLFCISGMHITFFTSILLLLLKKFKSKYFIVILFLLIYVFLTGFTPSILRASLLFIFIILNKSLKLCLSTIRMLIIIFLINLIGNPFNIYNIGFLLSYVVSIYLICFNKIISRNKNYITKVFLTSLIAFLVSMPIIINSYFSINLLTIINNIIFVPFVSIIILPLSLICLIIPKLIFIYEYVIGILESLSIFINKFKIEIILCHINLFWLLVYYIIITFVLYKFYKKKYMYLVLIIIVLTIHTNLNLIVNKKYISFLDVRQGDSIHIHLSYDNDILIDTGGLYNSNLSKNTISYLKSKGIKNIDYLIVTHGDFDHMGEAINLVENFKVEKVIFNCGEFNDLEKELIKVLEKKKIKYYSCIKELNIDNNKLYFLQTKEYDNENDNSNVIYTELDGYKFMFMGDAGVNKEKDILDKYNISDVDVLKIGHHGSKTSSGKEFITEINPKYSVISVGKNNRYGHPNKEVLKTLEDSKIYRTDQDGSIMFKIKNNKLKIETCNP